MTPYTKLTSRTIRLKTLRELNAPTVLIENEERMVLEAAVALVHPKQ